jgi:hypothetical protein
MTSRSKSKGNSWELDVAKDLTELYGESFIRAPHSGAYIGGSNSSRRASLHEAQIRSFKGDIIPGPSFPRLNIECKNYKDFPFHQLFADKECKQMEEWLGQLLDAAEPTDFNLLILKVTHKGKFIISPLGQTNKANLRFLQYNSSKHGHWAVSDYNKFWATNKSEVQTFSSLGINP